MKFAVAFTSRNNDKVTKKACIDTVAHLVASHHKVDLTSPDLVIIIEVFKVKDCSFISFF